MISGSFLLLRKPSHLVLRGTACGGFLRTSKVGTTPLRDVVSVAALRMTDIPHCNFMHMIIP